MNKNQKRYECRSPFRRALAAFLCAVFFLSPIAGCSDNASVQTGADSEADKYPEDGVSITGKADETTQDGQEKEGNNESDEGGDENGMSDLAFTNPLTGFPCDEATVNRRPVALMINNVKQSIPQLGIADADILYECIVEGGITRLMAVYSDYTSLPTTGSVRSSRDYFIDLAQAHDAIYAHCGGSEDAYSAIAARRIDNIDGVRGSSAASNAYWKDQDRVRAMGYEHASMTDGAHLASAVEALGYRTEISDGFVQPLRFSEPGDADTAADTGKEAKSVTVTYSYYAVSYFDYDAENAVYRKGQYGAPHIDQNTGDALTFRNVILLSGDYSSTGDAYNHLNLELVGSGDGYYIADGRCREIVWKKADRETPYALYEKDGETPLRLLPGKSYIGVPDGLSHVEISGDAA